MPLAVQHKMQLRLYWLWVWINLKKVRERTEIVAFPGVQNALISKVAGCSKGPVVVVVMAGSGLSVPNNLTKVNAILWVGYLDNQVGRGEREQFEYRGI